MTSSDTVTIVGAGLAGAACAAALSTAGVAVRVVERGRAPGGRMAGPLLHGRRVDIGAGYFTARDPGFCHWWSGWEVRGARAALDGHVHRAGARCRAADQTGPVRWATRDGLRCWSGLC